VAAAKRDIGGLRRMMMMERGRRRSSIGGPRRSERSTERVTVLVDDAVIAVASRDEFVDIPEEQGPAAAVAIDSDDEVLVPWVRGAVINADESVEATEEAAAVVAVAQYSV
jgi:hypothetical protein